MIFHFKGIKAATKEGLKQLLVFAFVALFVCYYYYVATSFNREDVLTSVQQYQLVTATAQIMQLQKALLFIFMLVSYLFQIKMFPCLNQLSDHVQSVLQRLQQPTNCSEAKLLVCQLIRNCGFGCNFHHVSHCLLMASGGNRTMIFKDDGSNWSYNGTGWEAIFQPVTKCKYSQNVQSNESVSDYFGPSQTDRIVSVPLRGKLRNDREHTNPVVPIELINELAHLHANPPAWFIAQIMKFLWKLNAATQWFNDEAAAKIPFDQGPIVGIHVRRTDKIKETKYRQLNDYMKWVDLWYDQQQQENGIEDQDIIRRLFIVTDEPKVLDEVRQNYSERYEIFSSESTNKGTGYNTENLRAFISDIEMLVRCNYVVCTFSSNVCRLIYELKQVNVAALQFVSDVHSLDQSPNYLYTEHAYAAFPWDAFKREDMQMARQLGANSDGGLNNSSFLPSHLFRNASFPIFRMKEQMWEN